MIRRMVLVVCAAVCSIGSAHVLAAGKSVTKSHPAEAKSYPPLEIKGMRVGMSMEDVKAQYPSAQCAGRSCVVDTTITSASAVFRAEFVDGSLDEVYLSKFAGSDVADAVQGFRAKYGEPQVSTRTVQNGYGSRFECPLYTWTLPDGMLWVANFRPDTRGIAQIEFRSAEHLRREEQDRKKSAGDI